MKTLLNWFKMKLYPDLGLIIKQQEQLEDAEFLIKSFLHSQYLINRAEKWLEKYDE